jgi:predicted naringenin-chalcone synthase
MTEASIQGLATAVPAQCYRQDEIYKILQPYLSGNPRTETIFAHAGIDSRYLAIDGTYYTQERTTQERNDLYMEVATRIGAQAIESCLASAGMKAKQIDDFIVVSCTGLDIPGLDLLLAGQLGMSPWLHRTCVLGMGCYGAFPGLLRAREAAVERPGRTALVLAVEICSVHFQPGDLSVENVVSSALFADGAGAVIVRGEVEATGPVLVDAATYCDYQTFDHMAFHVTDHGFRMSLSAYVPKLLAANIETFVDTLLARNGLTRTDVRHWGVHPGSSKILDYVQERLGLAENDLDPSRRVLAEYGNMSSATILFVLQELQRLRQPRRGEYGVLMSFGPGLTMESALVRW